MVDSCRSAGSRLLVLFLVSHERHIMHSVRILPIVLALLMGFFTVCLADEPAPGTQVAQQLEIEIQLDGKLKEVTLRYWLFLPEQAMQGKRLPLMLFLHGAGERGDDLDVVKKWGPPRIVGERKDFPFVVVSPQCPRNQSWNVEQMRMLVDHVVGSQKIDRKRIYVTGLSMGGYGSWNIMARYPRLFAAGVPICGGGDPGTAAKLAAIPIWAFHGDKDTAVSLKRSQDMITAIEEAGGKRAKLTIYPGVGHNSWSETYANEDVYTWLLSHQQGK